MKDLLDPDYAAKIIGHAAQLGACGAYVDDEPSAREELFAGEYWATLGINSESPEVEALYATYLEAFSMGTYLHRNIANCTCLKGAKEW